MGTVTPYFQTFLANIDGAGWKPVEGPKVDWTLKPGKNRLEIRVTNLWPNRLIGDQQLPPEQRRTRTNIRKYKKDSPLLPSGLLGPVKLEMRRRTPLS